MATLSVWVHLLKLESKNAFVRKYKLLQIPTLLKSSHLTTERKVLVDLGATDNFICSRLLKCLKIGRLKLKNPRTIWNIDGTHNKCYITAGCSVFDMNGAVVGPLTRAGLRRATKGSLLG